MVLSDIAFIIPDNLVQTRGFMHWGTEILSYPYEDVLRSFETHDKSQAEVLTAVSKLIGSTTNLPALIVGFGNNFCTDYERREDTCSGDNQRRYASVHLESAADGMPRELVPSAWCAGDDEDENFHLIINISC